MNLGCCICHRRPPARWVYADAGSQRHDPSHLLTHRLSAPLAAVAAALESDTCSSQAHLHPDSAAGGAAGPGGMQHMAAGRHGPGAVGQQQLKVGTVAAAQRVPAGGPSSRGCLHSSSCAAFTTATCIVVRRPMPWSGGCYVHSTTCSLRRVHSTHSLPSAHAQYNALLAALDGVAGRQVDASLAALGSVLTEPAVARVLSRNLPPGDA